MGSVLSSKIRKSIIKLVSVLLVHVLVKITEHSGPVSGFTKSHVLLLECDWNRLQLLIYIWHGKKYPFFGQTDIFLFILYWSISKIAKFIRFFDFYPFKNVRLKKRLIRFYFLVRDFRL